MIRAVIIWPGWLFDDEIDLIQPDGQYGSARDIRDSRVFILSLGTGEGEQRCQHRCAHYQARSHASSTKFLVFHDFSLTCFCRVH